MGSHRSAVSKACDSRAHQTRGLSFFFFFFFPPCRNRFSAGGVRQSLRRPLRRRPPSPVRKLSWNINGKSSWQQAIAPRLAQRASMEGEAQTQSKDPRGRTPGLGEREAIPPCSGAASCNRNNQSICHFQAGSPFNFVCCLKNPKYSSLPYRALSERSQKWGNLQLFV